MFDMAPEKDGGTALCADDGVYCARCHELVTRIRWAVALNGNHRHRFTNPAGLTFDVRLFRKAPGARAAGNETEEFTWFTGRAWAIGFCTGCGAHLGWRYTAEIKPPVFFGLIANRLTTHPG